MADVVAKLWPARWLAAAYATYVVLVAAIFFMPALIADTEGLAVEILSAGQDVDIPEDATVVDIKEFTYSPASITVAQNAKVVWTNQEPFDHDVTFKPSKQMSEELMSPKIGKDGKILTQFNKPGEYRYYCQLHPFMEGVVNVTPES